MIVVNVQSNIAKALNPIYVLTPRQYPFIVAKALTNTAQDANKADIEQMAVDLDRPTSFTRRGTFVRPATKQNLQAEVDLKDFAPKGSPTHRYLQPQIAGGPRRLKRFEYLLRAKGVLPDGMFAVPSRTLALDGYGNAPRALYVQILSALGAGELTAGYMANRTARSKRRNKKLADYFAVTTPGQRLPVGIYTRSGGGRRIDMLFAFVREPVYQQRYKFYETADAVTKKMFPTRLQEATTFAISTSRGV